MPSEQQLAIDFGVSKMTVRQALADLVSEGLLSRKPGVGTFVAQRKIQRNLVGEFVTFFEREDGRKPASDLLDARRVPADGKVLGKLQLLRGEHVVRLERVLLLDAEPVAVSTVYVPEAICPDLIEDARRFMSVYSQLEGKYHLFPVKAEQTVDAVKANSRVARLLAVHPGSPLLYIERTAYLEDGKPLEYTESYLKSERYCYRIALYRRGTDSSHGLGEPMQAVSPVGK